MVNLKKAIIAGLALPVSTVGACLFTAPLDANAKDVSGISDGAILTSCLEQEEDGACTLGANITLDKVSDSSVEGGQRDNTVSKNIVLDLNGYTISTKSSIDVRGEGSKLTVNDTAGGGKLNNSATGNDGYGFYVDNGGTIIINGGEFTTGEAVLAGNNTAGDMNFYVNGGTLTASHGAAIYMPGQVNLKITGGTINGGVNLRMGQVTISGGTINNTNSANTDTIEQYYKESGSVWYGSALAINAGTYESSNTTYGNSLNLTITGGTFNSTMSDAISLYINGRVAQDINVSISGGTFTSKDGSQAVLVRDLTVDGEISGYDESYKTVKNTANVSITGGTFSTSVNSLLSGTKYIETSANGAYTVGLNTSTDAVDSTGKTVAKVSSEAGITNGLKFVVEEETLSTETTASVEDAATKMLANMLYSEGKTASNVGLIKTFDANFVDSENKVVEVSGTDTYKVLLAVDESLVNGYDYIKVAYLDDNNNLVELLDATYEDGYVVFSTNHFSRYAVIGYNVDGTDDDADDTTSTDNVENPQTFDGVVVFSLAGILSVISLAGAGIYTKNS